MSNKITKKDIIDSFINNTEVERKDVSNLFDMIFEEIKKSISEGNTVELRGFGTFSPRIRHSRNYRNPKTGETLSLDDHYVAFFKPGIDLSEKMMNLKTLPDEK